MANVNNSNVYMYKPKIDQYERVNSLGVINLSKIKSTIKKNKKHLENADTSTSVTFDM